MKFEHASIRILEELCKKGDEGLKEEEFKKIKIGKNKLGEVLGYLSHKQLIVRLSKNRSDYRINHAGIDFLNNHKKENFQQKFNGIVAITGAIIALTAIYNFFMGFESLKNNGVIKAVFIVLIFLCFALIIPFIIDYWKREVFG